MITKKNQPLEPFGQILSFDVFILFSLDLERVKGIEPSSQAWEAYALPLSYTRNNFLTSSKKRHDISLSYTITALKLQVFSKFVY